MQIDNIHSQQYLKHFDSDQGRLDRVTLYVCGGPRKHGIVGMTTLTNWGPPHSAAPWTPPPKSPANIPTALVCPTGRLAHS